LDGTTLVVGDAVARLDTLIREEGAPLLSETRAMVAEADQAISTVTLVATEDLPTILSDVRAASETVRSVTEKVGADLMRYGESAGAAIETARVTLEQANRAFANANDTLTAINGALETGDRALSAAERAFVGVDRVITEDVAGIVEGFEATLSRLNVAIGQVSEDLPEIASDLRAATQSASSTFTELRRLTSASAPDIEEFTRTALPLYSRLAQESRTLIANLNRLTNQIQRDPARFFLDRGTPEFRR
jgi:phospholipid/cholesterol/gamma-HCH transport system substrate-binding protein